jgi:patatin-related protein
MAGIIGSLARLIHAATPEIEFASHEPVARHIHAYLVANGLDHLAGPRGGATSKAIEFFRAHDLAFRIRRLRLLARRLTQDWEPGGAISEADRDAAREAVYAALALYHDCEKPEVLGGEFPGLAQRVFIDAGPILEHIAERRALAEIDTRVDAIMARAMEAMPTDLRRPILLAYLGFPFYDAVTLPVLRGEGMTEFDPVKVDRISPDDATSIRSGGAQATLRGIEFYNFGAFFSRTYRENDYLWGRLHGAERMIDLVASALGAGQSVAPEVLLDLKREAFFAILDEEESRLIADPFLVPRIRSEIEAGHTGRST